MTDEQGIAEGPGAQTVVERLYDVALDPVSYESLLDAWQAELSATGAGTRSGAAQLDAHVARASAFLDRYEPATSEPLAEVLSQYAPFLAVALDRNLAIISTNFRVEPERRDPLMKLADLDFVTGAAAEDIGQLAEEVLSSGQEVIHAISDGRETDDSGAAIMLVKLRRVGGAHAPAAVIAIFSRIRWDDAVRARLQAAFHLSKTEIQIVRLILELKGRSDIARIRNRSVETIKRHFSAIFQKTGCRSTSELLILLTSFINLTIEARMPVEAEPAGLRSVTLPGGRSHSPRQVRYVAAGAVDGRACIHLPGPYCLSQWPEAAERAAMGDVLRIITPIRAGYGPYPVPERSADLASDFVAEILAIMDRLGIRRAPFVTQSNDIVFAFRFARKHPDRISAIVACGGALPLRHAAQYDRMDKWHRFILANARFAPRFLPFIVKAGFLHARRIGKKAFLERVHANAPGDLEVIGDPDCLRAIADGSRFALSDDVSAHRAFAESVRYFGQSDWSADVAFAEGRVPVYLVNGSADPMAPPETLDEFQATYPWIDIKRYRGAGEFVFFRHWPDVLSKVLKHV